MSEKKYTTLKDFYPYYLTEHSDPVCRVLHYIGTSLFLGLIVWSIIDPVWWKFVLMPLSGYGFAWAGHFIFEKNKPATFQYPLFSFRSDFIMFYHFITGQVDKKLEEAQKIVHGSATA
jgi:hypothetical protein